MRTILPDLTVGAIPCHRFEACILKNPIHGAPNPTGAAITTGMALSSNPKRSRSNSWRRSSMVYRPDGAGNVSAMFRWLAPPATCFRPHGTVGARTNDQDRFVIDGGRALLPEQSSRGSREIRIEFVAKQQIQEPKHSLNGTCRTPSRRGRGNGPARCGGRRAGIVPPGPACRQSAWGFRRNTNGQSN